MQFVIGFCTEFFSICLVCHQVESKDVIILFIALAIIADIDNYYAASSAETKLGKLEEIFPKIVHTHKMLTYKDERSEWSKNCRLLYKVLRVFFSVFYYYYSPFYVVLLSYLIPYYGEFGSEGRENDVY